MDVVGSSFGGRCSHAALLIKMIVAVFVVFEDPSFRWGERRGPTLPQELSLSHVAVSTSVLRRRDVVLASAIPCSRYSQLTSEASSLFIPCFLVAASLDDPGPPSPFVGACVLFLFIGCFVPYVYHDG